MVSFITIKMANLRRTNSTIEEDKQEVEKHVISRSGSDLDPLIEEKVRKTELRIMLLGKLENPKLECLRELYHEDGQNKIIPLGVKKS